MHEHCLTHQEILKAASQQTCELREMARNLSFWLDNVHHPSEGQHLESVVRSYLRRRLPKRFEISTGFIATLETDTQTASQPIVTRKVSRQFDILIWDADTFPALFSADNFVIVMPESVKAIIEVTKRLSANKIREDLEKFDDLYELYSYERQQFRPYTAIIGFSSKHPLKTLLQLLERFYLFDSKLSVLARYRVARFRGGLSTLPLPLPGFIDSICVVDKGLIKGRIEVLNSEPKSVVRYVSYQGYFVLDSRRKLGLE